MFSFALIRNLKLRIEIYRHTTRSIAGIKYNGRNLRRDTRSRKRRVVTSQVLAAAAVRRRPGPAADWASNSGDVRGMRMSDNRRANKAICVNRLSERRRCR